MDKNQKIKSDIDAYLQESLRIANHQLNLTDEIISISNTIQNKLDNNGKILICGNGGSAADSQHMAAELVVKFKNERKPIPAIALTTDSSILTSIGNDFGFKYVFSRQLEALGTKDDFLIVISTSGKSENIIECLKIAKALEIESMALLGSDSLAVQELTDHIITIPSEVTGVIQQAHITIAQLICFVLEKNKF
tara:strand:- start:1629 stop:2210 length:582 start_codon:yes stop_codon:yes gene_type:complete